eukprot:gene8601-biopygen15518
MPGNERLAAYLTRREAYAEANAARQAAQAEPRAANAARQAVQADARAGNAARHPSLATFIVSWCFAATSYPCINHRISSGCFPCIENPVPQDATASSQHRRTTVGRFSGQRLPFVKKASLRTPN